MPQTLTDIRAMLAAYGLAPKHRLGQNFLHDHNQLQRIIDVAEIAPGDNVLEVGPGTGALTERLLTAGADVLAVEVDGDLIPLLRDRLAPFGDAVQLIHADILAGKHALNPEVMRQLEDRLTQSNVSTPGESRGATFKLIANLPYNVASPLLVNLALDHPAMTLAIVMVQREVADRLCATPADGKAYGPLGIIIQSVMHAERLFTLGPGCFWPQPKVASAVVRLRRRELPLTPDPRAFAAAVHRLFQSRRKQIAAVVGRNAQLPPGIEPTMRAEELPIEQLAQLAQQMQTSTPGHPGFDPGG